MDGAVFAAAGCLIGGPSLLVMLGKLEVRVRMKFFFCLVSLSPRMRSMAVDGGLKVGR